MAPHQPTMPPQRNGNRPPGIERAGYTLIADLLAGIGFALLLAGAVALARLRGYAIDARSGLLWGAAGFAVFALAPAIGLPPELPGMSAAELAARQQWWLLTAAATAAGLGLVIFARPAPLRVLGAVLLVLPHLIGAPAAPHGANGSAGRARRRIRDRLLGDRRRVLAVARAVSAAGCTAASNS